MKRAERHKRIRTRLGLTQEEFAKILGVSKETVSRWEHGHYDPPSHAARVLKKIEPVADMPGSDRQVAKALVIGPTYTLYTLLNLAYKGRG